MTGDAHWRGVVQFQEQSSPEGTCWSTPGFARALALDLEQHCNMGFALAERDRDRDALGSPLFKRARESAACLDEMARDRRALLRTGAAGVCTSVADGKPCRIPSVRLFPKPASACVDVTRIQSCLGEPLLK